MEHLWAKHGCASEEFELGHLRELPPCNILVTDTWVFLAKDGGS